MEPKLTMYGPYRLRYGPRFETFDEIHGQEGGKEGKNAQMDKNISE